jgi:hypothetical protein
MSMPAGTKSAFPSTADIPAATGYVSFVPRADIVTWQKSIPPALDQQPVAGFCVPYHTLCAENNGSLAQTSTATASVSARSYAGPAAIGSSKHSFR